MSSPEKSTAPESLSERESAAALDTKPVPLALTFPEGGITAWLTVLGGAMVLFCTFGAIQAFGVYQDYYTRVSLSDKTPSDISWIGSLQVFLLFALALPAGKLFDEGYFRALLAAGSLIYLFSQFMLSLTQPHHYYQTILAQGVGLGTGMGLLFLPSVSIAAHYFRARRSLAMGFVLSGTAVGGIVWPIMLNQIFLKHGFPWGVRAAGFLALVFLALASIIMKTRLPSRKHRAATAPPDVARILRDVPFWLCCFGGFFIFWGIFFPFFYLQLFAILHGVPEDLALYSIPILNAGALLGRTLPNFLADHFGPMNVAIPMTTVAGALMFGMLGATTPHGLIAFAILYGFFSGAFISLSAAISSSFATDLNEVGVRIGITCSVVSAALLTGTPISGALLQPPLYTWTRPIIFNAVVVLFGCALLALSRQMVSRQKGTQRV